MCANKLFRNPIIAEQAKFEEAQFIPDPYLGHRLPEGNDFIGEHAYISLTEIIKEIQNNPTKKIVLNLGDSSTSGWDSNVVTENRKRLANGRKLKPAFFQYKTYSDYLRNYLKDKFIVINAGVPAYTSLQGKRRLELIINSFKENRIRVDYLTIYFGNNDSVWDTNREDKEWINSSRGTRKKIKNNKNEQQNIVTRVSPIDYGINLQEIIDMCHTENIIPITIEPQVPIHWKPGTRVKKEELPRRSGRGSTFVYDLLDEALDLWRIAIKEKTNKQLKIKTLEYLKEKDYIVPRIKKDHLRKLYETINNTDIDFISLKLNRFKDDIRYFIDYCHPIKYANILIAKEIKKVILKHEILKKSTPLKTNEKPELKLKKTKLSDMPMQIPTNHYTLY